MSDTMVEILNKVPSGHPRQCQALRRNVGTQCHFEAVEGGRVCVLHGGSGIQDSARVKDLNSYRLGKYQQRMKEFAGSDKLRSIDEEIGILRMVLESIFEQCSSNVDLLLYSQKIGDLVRDITKCVQVADKLAARSGLLIGRTQAMTIASSVVNILSRYVTDEDQLLKIAEEISDAFLTKVEGSDGSTFGAITSDSTNDD